MLRRRERRGDRPPFSAVSLGAVRWRLVGSRFRGRCLPGLFACLVLLTACSSVEVRSPALDVPDQWLSVGPADAPAPLPRTQWWRGLDDPQLNQLVARALTESPAVRRDYARLHAAEAMQQRASSRFTPSLWAGTEDVIAPRAGKSFFVVGIEASWPLPLFGRRQAANVYAQGVVGAAAAELAHTQSQVAIDVVSEWLGLQQARTAAALQAHQLALQKKRIELLRTRQHLQLEAPANVVAAEAHLAEMELQDAAPQVAVVRHAHALAAILGMARPDPAWLASATDSSSLPQATLYVDPIRPSQWLDESPVASAGRAAINMAAARAHLAHADRWPVIGFGVSLLSASHLSLRHSSESRSWLAYGPDVDIPLFDWGRRKAAARASDLDVDASVSAYRQIVVNSMAQIETALAELEHERRRNTAADQLLAARRSQRQAVQTSVQQGLDSPLDALTAEQAYLAAEQKALATRLRGLLALVNVQAALTGVPAVTLERMNLPEAGLDSSMASIDEGSTAW